MQQLSFSQATHSFENYTLTPDSSSHKHSTVTTFQRPNMSYGGGYGGSRGGGGGGYGGSNGYSNGYDSGYNYGSQSRYDDRTSSYG